MLWLILIGFIVAVMMAMGLDKAFNWQVALPRRPTFGQQMRAMAVEFFGKLAMLVGIVLAGFILWKALAS